MLWVRGGDPLPRDHAWEHDTIYIYLNRISMQEASQCVHCLRDRSKVIYNFTFSNYLGSAYVSLLYPGKSEPLILSTLGAILSFPLPVYIYFIPSVHKTT